MLELVHIPKTAGTALAWATRGTVHHNGHSVTLRLLRRTGPAITIVRDPVARFLSAFDWVATRQLFRWATPDEMARNLEDAGNEMHHIVFRHQSYWLDDDLARLVWVGHTETLDTDVEALAELTGQPIELPPPGHDKRNEARNRYALSSEGEEKVRARYADDYALLARLP